MSGSFADYLLSEGDRWAAMSDAEQADEARRMGERDRATTTGERFTMSIRLGAIYRRARYPITARGLLAEVPPFHYLRGEL